MHNHLIAEILPVWSIGRALTEQILPGFKNPASVAHRVKEVREWLYVICGEVSGDKIALPKERV